MTPQDAHQGLTTPMRRVSTAIALLLPLLLVAVIFDIRAHLYQPRNDHPVTRTGERISLRLKWIHQGQFAGFYSAARQGFYAQEGIDCEIKAGGQDLSALKLVAAGSDDFGVWGADQLIIARDKGIPVVALAVIYPRHPGCFTTLKKSGIRTPREFVGRRIGMQYGTDLETQYAMMLKKLGIRRNAIEEVPVQFNFAMLLEGRVDAWPSYAINEPILAEEKGYDINVIHPFDYGVRMYADTVFATESLIQEKPELVKRFLRATIRGWGFALGYPEQAVRDLKSYEPGIDEDHQLRMVTAAVQYVRPTPNWNLGSMDLDVWNEMEDAMREERVLERPVDVTKLVNATFINELFQKPRD